VPRIGGFKGARRPSPELGFNRLQERPFGASGVHENLIADRTPPWGAYSAHPDLVAGGEEASSPSLKTPSRLSTIWASDQWCFFGGTVSSISVQNLTS